MEQKLTQCRTWLFWTVLAALLAGLTLSLVSFLDLCSKECKASHDWELFGLPFGPIGILFFSGLISLHLLSLRYDWAGTLLLFGVAGALGAEVMLIWVQKYQIGHWCPVCLSIAATVIITFILLIFNKGSTMKNISGFLKSALFFALGFTTLYVGIAKDNPLEAQEASIKDKMVFGNPNAAVSLYLFTDWACPACRSLEHRLKSLMPVMTSKAKLTFVDLPVHPATMNYSPYNLAFMINSKDHYLKIRDALTALSEETSAPTEEQIEALAKKQGSALKELNYSDVSLALNYWKELADQFNVDATPTLVIVNPANKKGKKLSGSDINETAILKAIDTVK